MKAMILAAGLGTRMAPLSERRAKTVLPVLDQPLVLRMLRALAEQGIDRAIVNAHAHAEQLREVLAEAPIPVELSLEEELLGSGGGIRKARRFLDGSEPFLVLNGDMCVDLDVSGLLAAHRRSGARATLVLRDEARKHEFGTIGYAEGARVSRITDLAERGAEIGSGLFAGVQVIEPELFAEMPAQGPFGSMADLYVPMLRKGGALFAWLQPPDAIWWPVGTPRELLDANLRALDAMARGGDGRVTAEDARVDGDIEGPVWLGAGAHIAGGASVGPRAIIGAGAKLGPGASARDSLLLPGATPPAGLALESAIAHDGEVWVDA